MSENPMIIEATRGGRVESRHAVRYVICDADGGVVRQAGSLDEPVFPRSAIKGLQALPLIESGAADAFGLQPHHIALACSSHAGQPMHVEAARQMLSAAGFDETALECGPQLPMLDADRDAVAAAGGNPSAIYNVCSGKHAGFLCVAAQMGWEPKGYVGLGHPLQKRIAETLEAVTGTSHRDANHGIDGCSIPTYAIPLEKLAAGFARFGVAADRDAGRAAAMARIRDACMAHPEMVGGTGVFDTLLMSAAKGRVFAKFGAEGVEIAAIPELGLGIALKAADGAARAAETAMATLVESLLELDETELSALKRLTNPPLLNRNDIVVGEVRAAGAG